MSRGLLVFLPAVAAGLAVGAAAVAEYGGDPLAELEQSRLQRVDPQLLEEAIITAPEPRADQAGRPGESARCTRGRPTTLGNPWRCRVRYPSGRTVRYTVVLRPDGRYRGEDPPGIRIVTGTVALPPGIRGS